MTYCVCACVCVCVCLCVMKSQKADEDVWAVPDTLASEVCRTKKTHEVDYFIPILYHGQSKKLSLLPSLSRFLSLSLPPSLPPSIYSSLSLSLPFSLCPSPSLFLSLSLSFSAVLGQEVKEVDCRTHSRTNVSIQV
jgi:hypothetical protein